MLSKFHSWLISDGVSYKPSSCLGNIFIINVEPNIDSIKLFLSKWVPFLTQLFSEDPAPSGARKMNYLKCKYHCFKASWQKQHS